MDSTEVSWVIISSSFSCVLCLVHPSKHFMGTSRSLVLFFFWPVLSSLLFGGSSSIPKLLSVSTVCVGLMVFDLWGLACTCPPPICIYIHSYIYHLIPTVLKYVFLVKTFFLRLKHWIRLDSLKGRIHSGHFKQKRVS